MIILNILILLFFIIFWILSREYEKPFIQSLDEKQFKSKAFYPFVLYIMDKIILKYFPAKTRKYDDSLKSLYVGENLEVVNRLYVCNKITLAVLVIFTTNLLAFGYNIKVNTTNELINGKYIQRPTYEEENKKIELDVQISEDKKTILEERILIEVDKKEYDQEELEKYFQSAKEYIDSKILNKNLSSDEIQSDLNFVSHIPNMDFTVQWRSGNYELIDKYGKVHNEELKEKVLIWVSATINYKQRQEEYIRYFRIIPKNYTAAELARKNLGNALKVLEEQSQTEKTLELPDSIEQQNVTWVEKKDKTGHVILIFGGLVAMLLYVIMDRDLLDKVEKRNREMLLDYPEIINKFTLLVGAGMSLSNAWRKIVKDYKEKGLKKRYAYEELMITCGELMLGGSEVTAYERFGKRVKLLPYLRFSSMIAQNVKKGSAGLLNQLEIEALEAFEERKELAKRMGEEAGTKLLIPMMLMLLIVLAIIMVPAFLSFGL